MPQKSTEILKEISRLIFLVENSKMKRIDRLKIVKVLLAIKIKLLESPDLDVELKSRALATVKKAGNGSSGLKLSEKHESILQFIKNRGGRVASGEFLELGIASRSLRRYLRSLCDENKIKIEKSGRNNFYLVVY